MNLVKEIDQRSKEWHQLRKGSIGGTRVKSAFAKNNLPLIDELIAERHSDHIEETFVNDAMQRGIDLEPVAIAEFQERTDLFVDTFGLVTNDKFKGCHLSPDGLILDGADVPMSGVEIKCPSTKKHVEYLRMNKIPAQYKAQVMHYFIVIDSLQWMDFVSFDPRIQKKLFIFRIHRNDPDVEMEIEMRKMKYLEFWNKLQKYERQILE